MKKKKTSLFILTCTPNKRSKAKERKIFINGDYAAVMQMIEQISKTGNYAYSVVAK